MHEIGAQFKCSLCAFSSDTKTEVEEHFAKEHPKAQFSMIRQVGYMYLDSIDVIC